MKRTIKEIMEKGLKDPRRQSGIRHKFIDIILIGILSVLTGGKGFTDMEDFGKANMEWLKTFLELPNGIPSHDVFNDVFAAINPKEFHNCFSEWVQTLIEQLKGQVIGIDGKTARRTKDISKGKKALHVVSAWASQNSLVLGQIATNEKSNEITAIPELLKTLVIKGCIITIDAMGTQKNIAKTIIKQEADYILSVKENQKTLHDDIKLYMETEVLTKNKDELKIEKEYYRSSEKGHGRLEIRECYISKDIGWLSQKDEWVGLRGFGVIVSKREINGKKSEEKSYFIHSIKDATAEKILNSRRSHWSIENSLHWVMDVAFREDDSRIRTGYAAENMNVLIHIAMNLLKSEKTSKRGIAGKMYNCAINHEYLLKVLNNTAFV